ncbi:peptidase [Streptomyces sp. C10-9-1]|uniref:Clp protease N-terminal domain-containing protein n=1 Tax=Streptomyces sp. C10-9-1 TaxID=1859285 RepID=UPI0021125E68|nr:Clp protease N-terminal domain-containing protein [Streptomyces sp. C10-9-1]MCQ6554896.1 peptidase [Streptomyces sp. C10-9-1]
MYSSAPPTRPCRAFADRPAAPGAGPAAVLSGARRRALRGGDRHTDTAHLLHSLLESDDRARAAVGDPARAARVLGYLVQRSIGYGLRWQRTVEGVPPRPGHAARCGSGSRASASAALSPSAAGAVAAASARARRRGGDEATGLDLLASLAADPTCRAVEVLRRAGVDPAVLTDRIASRLDMCHRGDGPDGR